ncbi:MAG: cell envelope integrity protein CreD [Thermoanaerobaculia bacterium]
MTRSVLVKVLFTGFLVLLLLIPNQMIQSVVNERQSRRSEAVAEVASHWGEEQTLVGPLLTVPFRIVFKDAKGREQTRHDHVQLFPESLDIDAVVRPEQRRRGIFDVIVYETDLNVKGTMPAIDLAAIGVTAEDVLWPDATFSVSVSGTRGIKEPLRLTWESAEIAFEPGLGRSPLFTAGVHAKVAALSPVNKAHPFSFKMTLRGSQSLSVAPVAVRTSTRIRSSWPHPSFYGAVLPDTRTQGAAGFDARWAVSYLGRNYPQQWRLEACDRPTLQSAISASAFGVRFYQPVDLYQLSTRTIKYAILFLGLTFLAFFLFEVFGELRLHPLQYLFVGSALLLFGLLLVALSEHIGFQRAYLASAAATIALITAYSAYVLVKKARAALIGGMLCALYGSLFILLQMEDEALLAGTLGLFTILAVLMLMTRRVDWYAVSVGGPPRAPAVPPVSFTRP